MASASVFAAAQVDDVDWAQPAVDPERTTFFKTYNGACWHAPEDTIILMQRGKRHAVPLSLFTAEAIAAYDAGHRPVLISPDVQFQPASLGPYDELDKTLSYLAWESAWKVHLAAMESVFSPESFKKLSSACHLHLDSIRARLSEHAWPALREYDRRWRRKFWNKWRLAESKKVAGGKGPPPTLEGWDETEWDDACNYVGIKAAEALDIKSAGDSLTRRQLALILGGLKSGEEAAAAGTQDPALADGRTKLSTITAQKIAERLAEETRVLDVQMMHGMWSPFDFPASLRLQPPQQQQPPAPRKTQPSVPPPAYSTPSPASSSVSPPLPRYQPPPPPPGPPPPRPLAPYAYYGGPTPQGTSATPHASSRLNPPSGPDQLVAHAAQAATYCAVCGMNGPQQPHWWGECEDYDKRLFFKIGQAIYRRDAPTPNVPCCANFFGGKCSRVGEACPRSYYHVCSGCGEYDDHFRIDCPTSPKMPVPPATRPRFTSPYAPPRAPEYPNKRPKTEPTQAGPSAQGAGYKDLNQPDGGRPFR
ncbi:hypothetical protein JCM5296_004374 [Sporobolomyces johnsonii]